MEIALDPEELRNGRKVKGREKNQDIYNVMIRRRIKVKAKGLSDK